MRPDDEAEEDAQTMYRQTVMFSATMPPALEKLARTYMRRPAVVSIGGLNEMRYVETIQQQIEFVRDSEKKCVLAPSLCVSLSLSHLLTCVL
jgi:ATP-dependent RNA helicase DDX23/PRP28